MGSNSGNKHANLGYQEQSTGEERRLDKAQEETGQKGSGEAEKRKRSGSEKYQQTDSARFFVIPAKAQYIS